jgi:BirA family biotin operon repressor/biotin-[acetyl-CoA-carboxylase] ligase
VFATVVPVLLSDILRFEEEGFLPFQSRFAQRDVLWQQELHLSDGTAGTGVGVDEHGVLLVQTSEGLLTINSQEVSVRPVQKPTGNSSC